MKYHLWFLTLFLCLFPLLGSNCDGESGDNTLNANYFGFPIPSGELDTSFGTDGVVIRDNDLGTSGQALGMAVTIQRDGKIVVAGYTSTTSNGTDSDLAVWRFHPDGSSDTDFGGGDGVFISSGTLGGSGKERAGAIALRRGNIYVTGYAVNSSGNLDMVVLKLDSDGDLDTSFGGGDGIFSHDGAAGGTGDDVGTSIVITDSGRLLVAGYSQGSSTKEMAVWKLLSDGTLDTSFGSGDGIVTYEGESGGSKHSGGHIERNSDGTLVICGHGSYNSQLDLVVWKLTSDGNLDTSFGGGDGIFTHDGAAGEAGQDDSGNALRINSSGEIIIVGRSTGDGNFHFTLWKLSFQGELDPSFGNGLGYIALDDLTEEGSLLDLGYDLILQPDGKIIAVGTSFGSQSNIDVVVIRLTTQGELDTTFGGGDGIIDFDEFPNSDSKTEQGLAIAWQRDGKVVVTGLSGLTSTEDLLVLRIQ